MRREERRREVKRGKIEKRGKNFSISEKPGSSVSTANLDQRLKSRSVSYKPLAEYKDVIVQYEKDIIDHMCAMSVKIF